MRPNIFLVWLIPFLGVASFASDDLPQPKKDPRATPPATLPQLPAPRLPEGAPRAENPELQRLLDELRSQRDALRSERATSKDRDGGTSTREEEINRLQQRLDDLLRREALRRTTRSEPPARTVDTGKTAAPPERDPRTSETPPRATRAAATQLVDPVGLGQNLFRLGDYAGALEAFQKAEEMYVAWAEDAGRTRTDAPGAEERMPVKYMTATCLRKLGRVGEAEKIYREVAGSRGDPFLADCAAFQLNQLAWRRSMEQTLAQLRQREKQAREALEAIRKSS